MNLFLILLAVINAMVAMWNASLGNFKTAVFNAVAALYCICIVFYIYWG